MLKIVIIPCVICVVSSMNSYDQAFRREYENAIKRNIDIWIAGFNNKYKQFNEVFATIDRTLRDLAVENCNKINHEFPKYYSQGITDMKDIALNASSLDVTTTDCENIQTKIDVEYEMAKIPIFRCNLEHHLIINDRMNIINLPDSGHKLDELNRDALECINKDNEDQAWRCILQVQRKTLADTNSIELNITAATKKLRNFESSYNQSAQSFEPFEHFKTQARSIVDEYKKCVESLISQSNVLEHNSKNTR